MTSNIGRRRAAAMQQDAQAYSSRRREIVEAAARLFRRKGYASTSFNDIAEELGTDRATIYYYVASKKELLLEAVREAVEGVAKGALAIRKSEATPPEKLRRVIEALLNSYSDNYPNQFVYIQEGMAVDKEQDKDLFKFGKLYEKCVVEILQEGIADGSFRPDGDAKVLMYGILGALNWTHRWMNPQGRLSAKEIAALFSAVFLEGLVPRAPPPETLKDREPSKAAKASRTSATRKSAEAAGSAKARSRRAAASTLRPPKPSASN
ncbi:TetR/AcrR family transcriptional regulator [Ramlibacter sp.]|uniref:TetR/AcrR family transcriptional regulator n=1 Tax=Ramlibacter sp. TaxID=1917967 RepID=UPI003D14F69B